MDRRTQVELAALAARIMAESGLDWLGARAKAARRLGVGPGVAKQVGESDIRQALLAHQKLFEPGSDLTLYRLRQAALQVMRQLDRFNPALHGAIAAGAVTDHTPIELSAEVDSEKELESYLLNAGIEFDVVAAVAGDFVRYRCDGSEPAVVITANIRKRGRGNRRAAQSPAALMTRDLEALLAEDSRAT